MRPVAVLSCVILLAPAALLGCAPEPSSGPASATISPPAAPQELQTATPIPVPSHSTPVAPDAAVVDVVITTFGADASGVYASGIVPGVVESGGTCVLRATNGRASLSAGISAVAATEATNCGLITIPADPGTWEIELTYSSATSHGASDTQEVSLP